MRKKGNFYLLINKEKSIVLPNKTRTDPTNEEYWMYFNVVVPQEESNQSPIQNDPMDDEKVEVEHEPFQNV